jgi:hypothetical protein
MPRAGRFSHKERDPVLILQESVWAPGPVWTGAESVAPYWSKVCGLIDKSTKQIERTADICCNIHLPCDPLLFRDSRSHPPAPLSDRR